MHQRTKLILQFESPIHRQFRLHRLLFIPQGFQEAAQLSDSNFGQLEGAIDQEGKPAISLRTEETGQAKVEGVFQGSVSVTPKIVQY